MNKLVKDENKNKKEKFIFENNYSQYSKGNKENFMIENNNLNDIYLF